ncbi:hypothetical protein Zm00014a_017793 [Zea mays]|uniref:ATP-dependent DNA helicase n=1 Tax=Zea mays TaxID=4577 RepID=A0A3L6FV68_MAIZE|nr:hypothetical protein Zm00014a_017793 [Zea mays]PWZ38776.1 hypothetical protein Zm00014a_017793 [Zea mays]PWZ38777.1 hypothetical protein Zm00014a_017793 [Zea mays]
MDQIGYNVGRTPFTDISNTIITGNQNESNSLGPIVDAKERKRQRDRERYAAMTVEEKNEKNRKRREARQRNKGLSIEPLSSRGGDEQVNLDACDDSDWLHRNETFQANNIVTSKDLLTPGCVHETVDNIPKHTMKRAAYFSERYKNMTPVERESRRVRLRLYNKTPRRKDANKECSRKRRALQGDTLNQESIAMEDPLYTPETKDVGSLDMSTEPLRHRHHVLSETRPATLGHRNQQFEAGIARNVATVTEDICDAMEEDDWTHPHPNAELHNNGDDDEGVIFEEDDDENDGYLFAGQYDETDEDIEIDGTQDESTATGLPDPYDKVYSNVPEETHMLKFVPNCGYCTAKKFEYEPPGFCCRSGKVELAPLETPPQLQRLWDSTDSDARHFRDNIRFFNGHFSFTSLYCCLDSMTTNVRDSGIYTFWARHDVP